MSTKKKPREINRAVLARMEVLMDDTAKQIVNDMLLVIHGKKQRQPDLNSAGLGMARNTNNGVSVSEITEKRAREETTKQILLLTEILEEFTRRAIGKFFAGILTDPLLRKNLISNVSRMAGKLHTSGSRKYPHMKWLSEKLGVLFIQHRDAVPPFTAEMYFEELCGHPHVDDRDGDEMEINVDVLQSYGWCRGDISTISLKSVRSKLTRIRKNNKTHD